jgi:hypothetical protein
MAEVQVMKTPLYVRKVESFRFHLTMVVKE